MMFTAGALLLSAAAAAATDRALSLAEALTAFRTEPGLRVELVASEPTVVSPVALAFDERGRMFVAENRGYPTSANPPLGIIALLEDTDRDGRFEKRTVFAEGLTFPNGVMPWKGGVLVTCAPDLLFLQDTNHDGRADVREVWFTGFDPSNTTQLRVSHPTLSIDNWIYVTSGLVSGKIRRPGETNILEIKTDFRFRPDLSHWEAAEGRSQFGLSFDDFGRRFICMNRIHVQHVVLPARYLHRNPLLSLIEPVQDCPESLEPEPLPGHRPAARIYPISDNITTADSHAGTFTAACGVTVYRGTALPREYDGSVLACDPAANLVHRDKLIPSGSTFIAKPTGTTNEFLASTDNWFRPVFLANGPDGTIYICDMYRRTIEHPQYLPEEMRKRTDFDSGKFKGRIYRITGQRGQSQVNTTFEKRDTKSLLALLAHQESWWRDTAHRLLLERRDRSALPDLERVASESLLPQARVHALNLLDAFGALDDRILVAALNDAHAPVREHAVRLSEPRLSSEILQPVLAKATDPDPRVRLQCAASLGETSRKEIVDALVTIALRDANDRWTRTALLSSLSHHAELFLEKFLIAARAPTDEGAAELLRELGRLLGDKYKSGPLQWSRQPNDDLVVPLLAGWTETTSTPLLPNLKPVFDRAIGIVTDSSRHIAWRVVAAQTLRNAPSEQARTALLGCLNATQPQPLQIAAVRALTRMRDAQGALLQNERWRAFPPALRAAIISGLMSQPRHWPTLLDAIESKTISESLLTRSQRKQLLESKDSDVKSRAAKLFELGAATDRMKVYDDYKSVLALSPNPQNGRAIFKQHCAPCHRLDREGVPVGPDLFGIRNQEREVILLHIIVPEHEIVPGYAAYRLQLKDGRELEGMIAAESDTHIRLRRALGEEESVPRDQIQSLESSGLSLMPQEMEKNMSRQDMADLVAYLKGM
jgi:putative membrane-bound dehydrogenase-like protein